MSRRGARRNAFYLLFQMDFSEAEEFEQVKELFFAEKEEPVEEEDKEFILSEVEGVHAHMAEIDEMITASANGWDPARMNKVDLAILRLAVYEMKYGETPIGVAINEAVELAKRFSSDEAPAFINGVLDKIGELLGSDFYVLPSSTHEVILVPDNGNMQTKELEDMVKEVNATQVPPEDLLSDKVQYYDRAAKTLGRKQEKGLLERLSENKAQVQEREAKAPKERQKTKQEPSL